MMLLFVARPELNALVNYLRPLASEAVWMAAEVTALIKLFALKPGKTSVVVSDEVAIHSRLSKLRSMRDLDLEVVLYYRCHCSQVISNFNVRELIRKGDSEFGLSYLDEAIARTKGVIQALASLHNDDDGLRNDLSHCMDQKISDIFGDDNVLLMTLEEKVTKLLEKVQDFGLLTLDTILKRCGNFGLSTWCPLLSNAILKATLPVISHFIFQSGLLKVSVLDFHNTTYMLFVKLKAVSRFQGQIDPDLYATFEPCLPHWAACAAFKANQQVKRVLDMKKQGHHKIKDQQQQPVKAIETTRLKMLMKRPKKDQTHKQKDHRRPHSWCLDQGDYDNWLEGAINVSGIFQSCHITWERLDWPSLDKSLEFGTELVQHLNVVFKEYIRGLHDIIMMDQEFDHHELVLALNSLYKSFQYLDTILGGLTDLMHKLALNEGILASKEVDKDTIFDLMAKAKEDVVNQADKMVLTFCEGQRPIFVSFIKAGHYTNDEPIYEQINNLDEEDDKNLLGYLNALLKFFHVQLDIGKDDLSAKYKTTIKEKLFAILEEEMLVAIEVRPLQAKLYEAVEDTIVFRRNVSLKKSPRLDEAKEQLWHKVSNTFDLISSFYQGLKLTSSTFRGELKFSIERTDNCLHLALRSVSKLQPRNGRNRLNFSLSASLVPSGSSAGGGYREKFATKVYQDRTDHLFDLNEGNDVQEVEDKYTFQFQLDDDHREKFIQIVLYDHSLTKTNKMCCGLYLISCSEIVETMADYSGKFWACPKIEPDQQQPIWAELKSRWLTDASARQFTKDFTSYFEESRKLHILEP